MNWVIEATGLPDELFLLRSDSKRVFASRGYSRQVRSQGLKQELIAPHGPQQNGMIERVIRALKEHCVHRHRFERHTHAPQAVAEWIAICNPQGLTKARR